MCVVNMALLVQGIYRMASCLLLPPSDVTQRASTFPLVVISYHCNDAV